MYLSENSITGTLPSAAIATLSQFGKLNVAYNFLTGTIPLELNAKGILRKYLDTTSRMYVSKYPN